MRFYTMAFVGMLFFESLLSGSLANRIGTPDPFFIDGTVWITGSLFLHQTSGDTKIGPANLRQDEYRQRTAAGVVIIIDYRNRDTSLCRSVSLKKYHLFAFALLRFVRDKPSLNVFVRNLAQKG